MILMDMIRHYSCCRKTNTTIIAMQIAWVVGGFLLCPVCYRVGNMTAALRGRCSACLRDLGLLLGEYARLDFVQGIYPRGGS